MSRRRVLWLIKGLGPGGAERLLVTAATVHDRSAFELHLAYLLPWKDQLVADLEALGVPCTCLDVHDERDPRWTLRLRRLLLNAEPFDIVHMHSPYAAGFARLVVRSLPKDARPRLVTTEHNPWSTYRRPTWLANAITAPLDDAVFAVSDEARASLPKGRRRRTETLVHGVVVDDIRKLLGQRHMVRRELGVAPETVLIGTIANYHRKKDWPTLLRATREVIDTDATVHFCLVGQGPLEGQVQELHRELHLDQAVTLTGHRPDAVRLMAGCDVFVLASKWEGLPVALMEACALGLPIVATAVGGIPEHFTNGLDSLLVAPSRSDFLASAILDLVGDGERRRRLAHASVAHSRDFEARQAVDRIEAVYRDMLGPLPGTSFTTDHRTPRPARPDETRAVASLHTSGIPEGFLATLGPRFLGRLYACISEWPHSFLLVTEDDNGVSGFIAVAEDTGLLYRRFLLRHGIPAALLAAPSVLKAPRRVFETLRYGAADGGLPPAEILAVAVAPRARGAGVGAALVAAGVAELTRRDVAAARVVTASDNTAALRMYERAGFERATRTEVHRGVSQEVLVWH